MNKSPNEQDRVDSWPAVAFGLVPAEGFTVDRDVRPLRLGDDVAERDDEEWLVAEGRFGRRSPIPLLVDEWAPSSLTLRFERLGADPSRARVLKFANVFGFLGNPTQLIPAFASRETGGHRVDDLLDGERVSFWQDEALRFRDLRETWRRVQELTDGGPMQQHAAREYLATRIIWVASGAVRYDSTVDSPARTIRTTRWIASGPDLLDGSLAGRLQRGDLRGPASLYVRSEVNDRLRGHVSPQIGAFEANRRMRLYPDSLLSAIYFRFALDMISPSVRGSRCDHCGNWYAQTRRDRRFCSKSCKELARYHKAKDARAVEDSALS